MKVLHVIAVILIVFGFGIMHSPNKVMSAAGSVAIGIGCLYFIVLILISSRKDKSE